MCLYVPSVLNARAWPRGIQDRSQKFLALFHMAPPLERAVVRWAAQLIQKHVLGGMNNANSVPGVRTPTPPPDDGPLPGDEN